LIVLGSAGAGRILAGLARAGFYVSSSIIRLTNCSAVSIAAAARSSGTSVSGPSP
jgi:hypothetical protein